MVVGDVTEMNVTEAAERMGYHPGSIRRLIADGRLPARWDHTNERWLINAADVESYNPASEGQPSPVLRDYPVPEGFDLQGRYRGRVREYLPGRGYSVREFADAMGVDYSLVFMVDNGDRAASPQYRAKACAILEYPESVLFYRSESIDN